MRNDPRTSLRRKLISLVDTVLEEATTNPAFMERLLSILGSPSPAPSGLEASSSRTKEAPANLLEVLHSQGEVELVAMLDQKTTEELARIASQEGVRKLTEAKQLDRESLLGLLVERTKGRLKQGESFTKRV